VARIGEHARLLSGEPPEGVDRGWRLNYPLYFPSIRCTLKHDRVSARRWIGEAWRDSWWNHSEASSSRSCSHVGERGRAYRRGAVVKLVAEPQWVAQNEEVRSMMGVLVILFFGGLGFVVWAIASRMVNYQPPQQR
jgi:hypothetical protein